MKRNISRIFIIDDDKLLTTALKNEIITNFPDQDIEISTFEAGEFLEMSDVRPDIAIVDYHMDGRCSDAMNGVEIIDQIKQHSPETEIIMFTGDDNIGIAVEAFEHGAHDFVVKNHHMFRRINISLLQCFKSRQLRNDLRRQKTRSLVTLLIMGGLLGIATVLQFVLPQLHK